VPGIAEFDLWAAVWRRTRWTIRWVVGLGKLQVVVIRSRPGAWLRRATRPVRSSKIQTVLSLPAVMAGQWSRS